MIKKIIKCCLLLIMVIFVYSCSEKSTVKSEEDIGFLHADGKRIVNGAGDPIILRGMGFGGWMVQEPYMMQVSESAHAGQHTIFENIEELIGPENLETYKQAWLNNYCTEKDIQTLKILGFNSLRVALHYNLFTLQIL